MRNKRLLEALKSALIVLLTVGAVCLASATGLFADFFSSLPVFGGAADGSGVAETAPGAELSYRQAAPPLAAAVKGSSGLRYGVKYDGEKTGELYGKFRMELGEALGSASPPKAVSEKEWREALAGRGVFFDFGTELPFDVLCRWLGASPINENKGGAERLLMTDDGGGEVLLYYMDGGGGIWSCDTRAGWRGIAAELDAYLPNGAQFAFEKAELSDAEPYSLILSELPALFELSASGSAFDAEAAERASEALGIGIYGDSSYTEADGSIVYLDDSGTIMLRTDGYIVYLASEGSGGLVRAEDAASMVECAGAALERIHESFAGEEELYFTGLTREGETCVVSFGYFVNGIEVKYGGGAAATAVFEGGGLTQFKLRIRSYETTGIRAEVMPEYQAAAAAGSLIKGSQARLVWPDGGFGDVAVAPKWIAD